MEVPKTKNGAHRSIKQGGHLSLHHHDSSIVCPQQTIVNLSLELDKPLRGLGRLHEGREAGKE
jgi:hypothetical protein